MESSEFKIQDIKNSRNLIEKIKSREDMTDTEFNDFMELSWAYSQRRKTEIMKYLLKKIFKFFTNNSIRMLRVKVYNIF